MEGCGISKRITHVYQGLFTFGSLQYHSFTYICCSIKVVKYLVLQLSVLKIELLKRATFWCQYFLVDSFMVFHISPSSAQKGKLSPFYFVKIKGFPIGMLSWTSDTTTALIFRRNFFRQIGLKGQSRKVSVRLLNANCYCHP